MRSHVYVEPSPDGDEPFWHDVVCRVCGDRARMNPADAFVPQVRVFLDLRHRHGAPPADGG